MNIYGLTVILCFIVGITFGQGKIPRPDIKIDDPVLEEFISELKNAVANKDKEYIISMLSPDILNSFGDNGGVEEFKSYWNWPSDDSSFWNIMTKLLKLGGGEYQGNGQYIIPYVTTDWPDDEKYDAFEHMVITGTHVNIRDKPDLINSKVVGQFSYDIVKVDHEKSFPSYDETIWYYTVSLDGKLKGYVFWEYIWSPIGYRASFEFIDHKWKMTFLVAGD
jgi:hypothetical protein